MVNWRLARTFLQSLQPIEFLTFCSQVIRSKQAHYKSLREGLLLDWREEDVYNVQTATFLLTCFKCLSSRAIDPALWKPNQQQQQPHEISKPAKPSYESAALAATTTGTGSLDSPGDSCTRDAEERGPATLQSGHAADAAPAGAPSTTTVNGIIVVDQHVTLLPDHVWQQRYELQHLALDISAVVVQAIEGPQLEDIQSAAYSTLLSLLGNSKQARMVVKLLQAFRLTEYHSTRTEVLLRYVQRLSSKRQALASAITIALMFEDIAAAVDLQQMMIDCAVSGQEEVVLNWLEQQDPGGQDKVPQVSFVSCCLQQGALRAAVHAVRRTHLHAAFPDVEDEYMKHKMNSMLEKGVWGPAAELAATNDELKVVFLSALAHAGELALSADYALMWGMAPQLSEEQLAKDAAARRAKYLQLPDDQVSVQVVDTAQQLEAAVGRLQAGAEAQVALGIDVEWQPSTTPSTVNPASILQVATMSHVVIIDLLALAQQEAQTLDASLERLFLQDDVYVVGFDVANDLRTLASSYPTLQAWRYVPRLLDLKACGVLAGMEGGRRAADIGLSKLVEHVLGKPLDKAARMTAWNARPLSPRQISYAALDAWAVVALHSTLYQRGLGPQLNALAQEYDRRAGTGSPSRGRSRLRAPAAAARASPVRGM